MKHFINCELHDLINTCVTKTKLHDETPNSLTKAISKINDLS